MRRFELSLPFIRNTAHHSFFEMFFIDDGVIKSCKTRHMSSFKTSVFLAVFSFFFSKWDKGSMLGLSILGCLHTWYRNKKHLTEIDH